MRYILPVIVIAQFLCTSVWFAGNAITNDIVKELNLSSQFLAHLTSAIQLGFITGTFFFALFTISDRFSPSKVFFVSALVAGLFNLGLTISGINSVEILILRFFTGFFLAGIYPVGMKISSDYYKEGLGKSLGFLVGALVLGTALPHAVKNFAIDFPWKYVIHSTSVLCATGGLLILLFVPDGPYRKPVQKIELTALLQGFKLTEFRSIAFGYFGHMWELYTFWAFVPVMLATYNAQNPEANLNVALTSFIVIGCGALSCVVAGLLSQYFNPKKIAVVSLFSSGVCCLLSPLFLFSNPYLLIMFLILWGILVIADSPMFSSLIAQNAPEKTKGTSLTIVNCIGFAITVVSIQFINTLSDKINPKYIYLLLAIGPLLGLIALLPKKTPLAKQEA